MEKLRYLVLVLLVSGCGTTQRENEKMEIVTEEFGMVESKTVHLYTMKSGNGMTMRVTNFGGIVTSITVPDKDGNELDVVLGYETMDRYLEEHPYFGAIVGRFANRIALGKFSLNGTDYQLATNNGPNHLHGGLVGFDKVIWDVEKRTEANRIGLVLSYVSMDGEEGYPGQLHTSVTYWLTDANEWIIEYEATTDAPTILNLTQHAYFNLSRQDDILDHELTLYADSYLPVDELLIPLGPEADVVNTPFDFLQSHRVGERINLEDEQLVRGGGYDHCWILNGSGNRREEAAELYSSETGIAMAVRTTQPAIQFYTGNFLDGTLTGKGENYAKRAGLCLETQQFPDAPNQPDYPSVVLNPGETFRSSTSYQFSIK